MGFDRVELYCDAVEQTASMFEIGSAFASDLMTAIKNDVTELIAPLACHVRVDSRGRNRRGLGLATLSCSLKLFSLFSTDTVSWVIRKRY